MTSLEQLRAQLEAQANGGGSQGAAEEHAMHAPVLSSMPRSSGFDQGVRGRALPAPTDPVADHNDLLVSIAGRRVVHRDPLGRWTSSFR